MPWEPTGKPLEESRRIASLLAERVRASCLSQAAISKSMGCSPSYLSQVLRGLIDLKWAHVVAVLETLNRPMDEFVMEAYGLTRAEDGPWPGSAMTEEEFDRRFEKALARHRDKQLENLSSRDDSE